MRVLRLTMLVLVCGSAFASPLTPAEKRGRQVYRSGESSAGRPITALVGGNELGASIFACGTCHGVDGLGVAEGNVEPSDIRWSTLEKILLPDGPGRRRPRYDEQRLARAIREGVDSAGNSLSPVMPRFRIGDEDLSDLIAYLKRLGNEPQPGLAADSITVANTARGATARAVIAAFFRDVNAAGGVFGRTLKVADVPPTEAFAVIGAAEGVESTFGEERVPLIAPFPSASPAPSSFFLFADLESQALALRQYVGLEGRSVHVLHDGSPAARAAATALVPVTETTSWQAILAAKRSDGDLLFLLGPGVSTGEVLLKLEPLQWSPTVLIAGASITGALFDAPRSLQNRIFLAAPTLPDDVTENGGRELHAFATRHRLPPADLARQIATYAAAKIFVEGLKRAGRDLTREKLIASLEQLYQFRTEVIPPVTFHRNRHTGAIGAHVLTVNLATRGFAAVRP